MSITSAPRSSPAREAWGLIFELAFTNKARFIAAVGEFDLTPVGAHALRLLDAGRPLTMSELADALACDASNVTGVVDRLEDRGLVERQPGEGDRRVKTLALTPAGVEARRRVLERMSEPPPEILRLSTVDQRQLRDILRRALGR
jgi:MarR family transcriptional regulator, organic hydroperoxide resistance regulator